MERVLQQHIQREGVKKNATVQHRPNTGVDVKMLSLLLRSSAAAQRKRLRLSAIWLGKSFYGPHLRAPTRQPSMPPQRLILPRCMSIREHVNVYLCVNVFVWSVVGARQPSTACSVRAELLFWLIMVRSVWCFWSVTPSVDIISEQFQTCVPFIRALLRMSLFILWVVLSFSVISYFYDFKMCLHIDFTTHTHAKTNKHFCAATLLTIPLLNELIAVSNNACVWRLHVLVALSVLWFEAWQMAKGTRQKRELYVCVNQTTFNEYVIHG